MTYRTAKSSYFTLFIIALCYAVLSPNLVVASQFLSRQAVTVPKQDTVDDDLYIFSNYGKIYGRINGDLSAFCYDVNSSGEVSGNANLFGFSVGMSGKVDRSARMFGNIVNCNGEVSGNLIAFGSDVIIGDKAVINRDATCGGNKMTVDGTVHGNLKISATSVIISGTVDSNVTIDAEKILIVPPATIKGSLHYVSKKEATIEEGVVIQGEKTWKLPEQKKKEAGAISVLSVILKFAFFVMALITGLILILLFREHTEESAAQIKKNVWVTFALGCLAFLIATVGALVLCILIVGIPLGVFVLSIGMILFYVGKVYVYIVIGRLIFGLFNKERRLAIGLELLVGLIILTILFQLPYIGWLIYILTFLLGMGAAVAGFNSLNKKYKRAVGAPVPAPPVA